jgi:hypothetical protein
MAPIALVVGAVASVVGTVGSMRAQKKAAAAQQRQEQISSRRSRRQAIREFQIQRAQAVATGQGLGAFGSSGLAGGLGSLGSQLGSELGYSTAQSANSAIITKQTQRANFFNALSSIGGSALSFGISNGGLDAFKSQPTPTRAPTPSIRSAYIAPTQSPTTSYPRPNMYTPI